MLHKTQGIVLRTIKYGETSLVCHIFTELFGLQIYMVKGARTLKKAGGKASVLYPGAVLDMVIYHQPHKNFQLIREFQLSAGIISFHEDVVRNCILLFAVEVLTQFIGSDDAQPELFYFTIDFLDSLASLPASSLINLPLFFLVHAGRIAGYQLAGSHANGRFADISEGRFQDALPDNPLFAEGKEAELMGAFNQTINIEEAVALHAPADLRRKALQHFLTFFRLHAPHFRELKTLPVLSAILGSA